MQSYSFSDDDFFCLILAVSDSYNYYLLNSSNSLLLDHFKHALDILVSVAVASGLEVNCGYSGSGKFILHSCRRLMEV